MREIIEALNGLKGKQVDIYTEHLLYGKQHIEMAFEPEVCPGLGFKCGEQAIYVKHDEIIYGYATENEVYIGGELMSVKIVKK